MMVEFNLDRRPIPSFTPDSSHDHRDRLFSCSPSTLKELISDASLEGADKE